MENPTQAIITGSRQQRVALFYEVFLIAGSISFIITIYKAIQGK